MKGRSLRQCNGCEAAVALKLGADQSFVGVVTRISRVEYAERFQIRDAHTGALVLARQTDLQLGADYSWNRGAAVSDDSYTLADTFATAALARFRLQGFEDWWSGGANPNVAAYYRRMRERPSWSAAGVVDTGTESDL